MKRVMWQYWVKIPLVISWYLLLWRKYPGEKPLSGFLAPLSAARHFCVQLTTSSNRLYYWNHFRKQVLDTHRGKYVVVAEDKPPIFCDNYSQCLRHARDVDYIGLIGMEGLQEMIQPLPRIEDIPKTLWPRQPEEGAEYVTSDTLPFNPRGFWTSRHGLSCPSSTMANILEFHSCLILKLKLQHSKLPPDTVWASSQNQTGTICGKKMQVQNSEHLIAHPFENVIGNDFFKDDLYQLQANPKTGLLNPVEKQSETKLDEINKTNV
jgi:hypothetical protein